MKTKLCSKCKKVKEGLSSSWCKLCQKEYDQKRYIANADAIKQRVHLRYINNLEKMRIERKERHKRHRDKENCQNYEWQQNNKEKYETSIKAWRERNPEKLKEYAKKSRQAHPEYAREAMQRKRSTPQGKLNSNISRAIHLSLKGTKAGRSWESIVDYTIYQLIERLKQTIPGSYTWQDYLNGKLHLDHIIPISVFNFSEARHIDFKRCWALENL